MRQSACATESTNANSFSTLNKQDIHSHEHAETLLGDAGRLDGHCR